ncbi:MAG: hypothetical protein DI539_00200 [Flavobacterium psychrophilum]|nr:MAG: hypothetical protein DI539_00200 [Flavobacterium psychrophilum]
MIKFVTDIDKDKLRMAYNNDILRFYSDAETPTQYADIVLNEETPFLLENMEPKKLFSIRLYPNPEGKFYANLQPYAAACLNTRNFEDTLNPSPEAGSPDSFTYSFSGGTVLTGTLSINITHVGGAVTKSTHPLTWLAGTQQHGEYTRLAKTGFVLLSPSRKDNTNEWPLKYWQGYPFDFSFYMPYNPILFRRNFSLKNETNQLSQTFNQQGAVTRLVFSDGRTDETLETLLPLAEGKNRLKFGFTQPKWALVEKVPYKCGVYLKWLNALGGYSYWLFENTYAIDRSTKSLGEMDRDNNNIENSFGRSISLGKESQDTMKIIAELLNEDDRRIVEGILDSPKIYLFTGQPFSQSSSRDWVEVTLKTSTARLRNPKQSLINFAFEIELPTRYCITI